MKPAGLDPTARVTGAARAAAAGAARLSAGAGQTATGQALLHAVVAPPLAALPWRAGQQLSGRVLAAAAHTATIQAARVVFTAATATPLPPGATVELVVRRVAGQEAEMQLVRLEAATAAAGEEAAAAPERTVQQARADALPAWHVAFIIADDGSKAAVTCVPAEREEQGASRGEPEHGQRLVIRWEGAQLGAVEFELTASAAGAQAGRRLRLAARANEADTVAALRAGLGELTGDLQALGFTVTARSVGRLRRRQRRAPSGLRLDTRL